MKKPSKPTHISNAVKEVFKKIDNIETGSADKKDILNAWYDAVEHKAAKHTRPTDVKGGTLLINVDSSVWIYRLRLQEADLVNKISILLKNQQIKKIRFRAGEVE